MRKPWVPCVSIELGANDVRPKACPPRPSTQFKTAYEAYEFRNGATEMAKLATLAAILSLAVTITNQTVTAKTKYPPSVGTNVTNAAIKI